MEETEGGMESTTLGEHVKVFEVCWEITKKVGGIYTVLRSKSAVSAQVFSHPSDYTILAPLIESPDQFLEFELETEPKSDSKINKAISSSLEKYGIKASYGRWLVKGYPRVLLFDLNSSKQKLNEWRRDLNQYFEPSTDKETNDAIIFGYQVALFLKEYCNESIDRKLVTQMHEWMSSVAIIPLKKWNIRVATVFTTHATTLGRFLSAARLDFYNMLDKIKVDKEAGERGVYQKHWIERAAANSAHVFTTVSEITSFEAKHLLGREADVLLPNGLQVDKFAALHEFQNLHATYKEVVHEFVRGHFYGAYDFDLENTLYFFTAGRYEVYNKGIDLYIDALGKLNSLLKQEGSQMTVIAFIITNAPTNSFNVESLKGQTIMKDLRKSVNKIVEKMNSKLFEATAKGKLFSSNELLDEEDIVKLKGRIYSLKQRNSLPPIVTHNMNENDEILQLIRKHNLFNNKSDRVKIIYHPEFLSSLNPVLPLDYTEFIRACHLGVFPSYYEPWGYTPAECTVMGVPSITSNLSGFGNFMARRIDDSEKQGIFIVDRKYKSYEESAVQIANMMWRFTQLSRRERIELRNRTEKLSDMLDWKNLHKSYTNARALAIKRATNSDPTSKQ